MIPPEILCQSLILEGIKDSGLQKQLICRGEIGRIADLELSKEVQCYSPVRMDESLGLSLEICSTTSFIGLTPSYVGHNQLPDELVCQLSVIISLSNNSGIEPLLAYS